MEISEIETHLADKPEVLEAVKGLAAKAALVTDEIAAELPKFGEYKQHSEAYAKILQATGAKDADALVGDFTNLKAVKADLEKQKSGWKSSGKPTDSPEYKALEEQLATVKGQIDALTDENKQAKAAAERAASEKRETDLMASITTAAGKHKATEPEDIFILAKAKGLTGIGEDGKAFFRKVNDKGELVAVATADDMIQALAAKRKDLFAASGVSGTGGDHRGTDYSGKGKVTPQQARAAFLAERGKR